MNERESKAALFKIYGKELGSRYQDYFDDLEENDEKDQSKEILNRLLRQEKKIEESVLQKLDIFTKEAERAPIPEVKIAREELRDFFEKNHGPFKAFGISLILYGSLQYNDPRNMDADIDGFTYRKLPDQDAPEIESLYDITDEKLLSFWTEKEFRGKKRDEPHLTIHEFNDLRRKDWNGSRFANNIALGLAELISGISLLPEDKLKVKKMKAEAIKITESDPFLLAVVNIELSDALKNRLERRSQLK